MKFPQGISNLPCLFQSEVECMMMGLKNDKSRGNCVCFLDDVMTGYSTFDGMVENLRAIFGRILRSIESRKM